MSSPLCVPAALVGRPVAFTAKEGRALLLKRLSELPQLHGVAPASRFGVRPAPEMISSGILEIDDLTGGLPRGYLSEICGPASSGRTSALLAALAAATRREEVCALVDTTDAFDPVSAAAAGMDFQRLLWVRCSPGEGRNWGGHDFSRAKKTHSEKGASAPEGKNYKSERPLEHALRVTDLLLQSGGFGLIAIDLGDVPLPMARRVPLTTWFRFQRAVEHTPTVLFVVSPAPCAPTCACLLLKVSGKKLSAISCQPSVKDSSKKISLPTHAQLLNGLQIQGELLRFRLERKPARSVTAAFATKVRAG
jgi:recombination protein RecA